MRKLDYKVGDKKGRLTITELLPSVKIKAGYFVRRIRVVCDCGKQKDVYLHHFHNGKSTSCGCYMKELHTTHGKSKTRMCKIWNAMNERCSPSSTSKFYYRKGIRVCEEWKEFENFYNWSMNNGYKDWLQIDRINNDGWYSPENCRWVTPIINLNNRSTTLLVDYKGEKVSFSLALIELGLRHKYHAIYKRVFEVGIPFEQAIKNVKNV